jgi:hypothetical protein
MLVPEIFHDAIVVSIEIKVVVRGRGRKVLVHGH